MNQPKFTVRQWEVLAELEYQCRDGGRVRPMDVGGMNGSQHSAWLAKFCALGWACRYKYGCRCKAGAHAMFGHKRCRGAFIYWITDLGRAALKAQRE